MKIALVHDYLSQDGGAERVLKAFHEIWPEAPIFVLFYDKNKIKGFVDADIRQSFLAKFPFVKNKYQWYLPLMPIATERYDLSEFDVVLSSTSAFSKGILTKEDGLHVSYCHTPTRYLWSDTHEYIQDLKYNFFVKLFLPRLLHKLRIWDRNSVDRVDNFIANSHTVYKRIKKYYRRTSDVIHPPVDLDEFFISQEVGDYFVAGGRIVNYKRFDLIIQAFNRLGFNLKIYGDGPALEKLKKLAKPNIEFLGRISDKQKAEILSKAKAFINPQVEDFGITPIEAMAAGRPVIAYGFGGVTETVISGVTGLFFYKQDWETLFDIVLDFDKYSWDSEKIRAHASKFDVKIFKDKVKHYVDDNYLKFLSEMNRCDL
ncbi:MAG: glycosyltransferase family 4 protein [Candidatus Magasanikbacteria bacterium CG_4_10_14_0_2_um_filter_33_14]|uniref:Glycosyltransferase family 4 protein n=1 Tax=Candidatus Magasanikbacteria bacterium CG_4_10_14_0_2_um_filter_33_14 TaxID=1974636 RepID=A0A2M7VBY3_9BACT|nr:MAG: glycosyltransferase family 4 protein [Candidatus Magasanikbacteria bacterium CG_4_10_14_0_2_um_filter_33_14]